jgi:hypothetical protein
VHLAQRRFPQDAGLAERPAGQLGAHESAMSADRDGQFTHDPRLAGMALAFHERLENGERLLEHGGDLPGFATLLALLPGRDLGFLVAYNSPDPMLREALMHAFLDRFLPRGPAPAPVADPAYAIERAPAIGGLSPVSSRSSRSTICATARPPRSTRRSASASLPAWGASCCPGWPRLRGGAGSARSPDGST